MVVRVAPVAPVVPVVPVVPVGTVEQIKRGRTLPAEPRPVGRPAAADSEEVVVLSKAEL